MYALFLDFQFYFIDLHVYPYPGITCFDYCSSVIRFEIGKCEFSNFVLLLKVVWLLGVP